MRLSRCKICREIYDKNIWDECPNCTKRHIIPRYWYFDDDYINPHFPIDRFRRIEKTSTTNPHINIIIEHTNMIRLR